MVARELRDKGLSVPRMERWRSMNHTHTTLFSRLLAHTLVDYLDNGRLESISIPLQD